MTNSNTLQDLITAVASDTSLTEEQSAAAVLSALRYLKARLPSPIVGQLHELLQTDLAISSTDRPPSAER